MSAQRWTILAALGAVCALAALPTAGQAAPGGDAFVEETTFTVFPLETGSALATCPAGTRIVGGGVNATPPGGTGVGLSPLAYFVQLSGPMDETGTTAGTDDGDVARSWYASVFNQSGTRGFRVFALCSRDSDAVVEAAPFQVANNGNGPDRDTTGATFGAAICPAGTRPTGGGVGTTGPVPDGSSYDYVLRFGGPQDFTRELQDGEVARVWNSEVRNESGATRDFKAFALCSAASDATLEIESLSSGTAVSAPRRPHVRRAVAPSAGG